MWQPLYMCYAHMQIKIYQIVHGIHYLDLGLVESGVVKAKRVDRCTPLMAQLLTQTDILGNCINI